MVSTLDLARVLDAAPLDATPVLLPISERTNEVRTFLRHEQRWYGESPESFRRIPNKPALSFEDQLLYSEFIILRLLEREGWSGVWCKNWGGRAFWRDIGAEISPPAKHRQLFAEVGRCAGRDGGAWDIFAWRGNDLLFIESKQQGKDSVRLNQLAWLECGIEQGLPISSFLIVEWVALIPSKIP